MRYDFKRSSYFLSLPALMKESIMQSGVDFSSDDELEQFVTMQNMQ